jgi:hypothetical protein
VKIKIFEKLKKILPLIQEIFFLQKNTTFFRPQKHQEYRGKIFCVSAGNFNLDINTK